MGVRGTMVTRRIRSRRPRSFIGFLEYATEPEKSNSQDFGPVQPPRSIQRRAADRPHGRHDLWITAQRSGDNHRAKDLEARRGAEQDAWGSRVKVGSPTNRSRACILEEMIPLSVLDLSPIVQGGT